MKKKKNEAGRGGRVLGRDSAFYNGRDGPKRYTRAMKKATRGAGQSPDWTGGGEESSGNRGYVKMSEGKI